MCYQTERSMSKDKNENETLSEESPAKNVIESAITAIFVPLRA